LLLLKYSSFAFNKKTFQHKKTLKVISNKLKQKLKRFKKNIMPNLTNTYPDGFPKTPLEAIQFSYFLADSEKQEWMEWLKTATPEQKDELVDILHSMWQDNQKNAVPENFTNVNTGPNNFGNNPTTNNQKPTSDFNTSIQNSTPVPPPQSQQQFNQPNQNFGQNNWNPKQTNQPTQNAINNNIANFEPPSSNPQQINSHNQQPNPFSSYQNPPANPFIQNTEIVPNFNQNSQQNFSENQNLNNQNLQFGQTQANFNPEEFGRNNPQQNIERNIQKLPVTKPSFKQITNSNQDNNQNFENKENSKPNQNNSDFNSSNNSSEFNFPNPKISENSSFVDSQNKQKNVEDKKPEPEFVTPQKKDRPDNRVDIESLVKDSKYKPSPILDEIPVREVEKETNNNFQNRPETNFEKSKTNDSNQNFRDIRKENPRPVSENSKPKIVPTIKKPQNNFREQTELKKPVEINKENRLEKENNSVNRNNPKQEPERNNRDRMQQGFNYSKIKSVNNVGGGGGLGNIYGDYIATYDENQRKYASFLQKLTDSISAIEAQMNLRFDAITQQNTETNRKLVDQAREIQQLKNATRTRGGSSLQEQIDDLHYDFSRMDRDFREFKTETRRSTDEISEQLAAAGADIYKDNGIVQKIDNLQDNIKELQQIQGISPNSSFGGQNNIQNFNRNNSNNTENYRPENRRNSGNSTTIRKPNLDVRGNM
jgi:hypothetical protein